MQLGKLETTFQQETSLVSNKIFHLYLIERGNREWSDYLKNVLNNRNYYSIAFSVG